MAKIQMSDGVTEMTVTEYAEMLEGQWNDAMNTLAEYANKGQEWSPEAIQNASSALPDGPAFDIEVLDAEKAGRISARSASRLDSIAARLWKQFAAMIYEATGKTLEEFEADTGMWDCSVN